ncbi:MAG: hypothetical protein VB140_00100 [Burkholderia sp.]
MPGLVSFFTPQFADMNKLIDYWRATVACGRMGEGMSERGRHTEFSVVLLRNRDSAPVFGVVLRA